MNRNWKINGNVDQGKKQIFKRRCEFQDVCLLYDNICGFWVFLPFCFDLGAKSYICKKSTHFKDKLTVNRNSRLPFHSLIFLQWLQWPSYWMGLLCWILWKIKQIYKIIPSSILQFSWGDKTYNCKRDYAWLLGIQMNTIVHVWHFLRFLSLQNFMRGHEIPSKLGELATLF